MSLQHGQNLHSRKKVIKMLHGRFVHMGKTLTDLQIFGCELHQNAFGGRKRPLGGTIALPQTLYPLLRGGEGRKGEGKGWE